MTTQNIVKKLSEFKKSPRKRQAYLRSFEKEMIYSTIKTERPETTRKMVDKVLSKY